MADLYEAIIEAASAFSSHRVTEGISDLLAIVLPTLITARTWGLADADTLARGVALEKRIYDTCDSADGADNSP